MYQNAQTHCLTTGWMVTTEHSPIMNNTTDGLLLIEGDLADAAKIMEALTKPGQPHVEWVRSLSEGIQRLKLTADKGYYLAPFARLLLAVAALRDKVKKTARVLLAGLATEFPHNQLYSKELARIQ